MSLLVLGWVVRVGGWRSSDLEPAGPTCSYEVDEGSGPAGYGTERVDWGLWPSRVCVTDSGEVFRGGAVDSTSPLQPDLHGAGERTVVDRHRRRRARRVGRRARVAVAASSWPSTIPASGAIG